MSPAISCKVILFACCGFTSCNLGDFFKDFTLYFWKWCWGKEKTQMTVQEWESYSSVIIGSKLLLTLRVNLLFISRFSSCSSCSFRAVKDLQRSQAVDSPGMHSMQQNKLLNQYINVSGALWCIACPSGAGELHQSLATTFLHTLHETSTASFLSLCWHLFMHVTF